MAKIIIFDDEKNIRETIKDILTDEGHTVYESDSGLKGLITVRKEEIDIAIVDIWMPLLNGLDVMQKIRQIKPGVEVIIISGHANVDVAVKAMKNGAFDFLEKPLSMEKILSTVNRALNRSDGSSDPSDRRT